MNPEERHLLERSLRLGEENNKILKRIDRRARWAQFWGFVKLAVIAVPLILGYVYFEPYFKQVAQKYDSVQELVGHVDLFGF